MRTFFVYCQMGRNLYNWQHSKADWGGRWTCVLFDPKTKGLNPLWQWILLFLGHPQWVILFSSCVVLNTLEVIRHLTYKLRLWYYTISATNPATYPQVIHSLIHSILTELSTAFFATRTQAPITWPECCNTIRLLAISWFSCIIVFLVTEKVKTIWLTMNMLIL